MSVENGERCASELRLDRWLAGELSEIEAAALSEHVRGCGACRSRHGERVACWQRFASEAPAFSALARGAALTGNAAPSPGALPSQVAARTRRPSVRWLAAASVLAAAAAIALGAGELWRPQAGTRFKGSGARLGWVVKRGEHVFRGGPDTALRAGDVLRFSVDAPEAVFVAVLGADALGRTQVYFPEGERQARVEAGREQLLPAAIALDAIPGDERLLAIFCSTPQRLVELRAGLDRAPDAPVLPSGCSSQAITLKKDPP